LVCRGLEKVNPAEKKELPELEKSKEGDVIEDPPELLEYEKPEDMPPWMKEHNKVNDEKNMKNILITFNNKELIR
jgi:hypothetical protein